MNKPLIFTHIPKCGGSSIRESARRKVGDDVLTAYSGEGRELVREKPLVALKGKRALFGHFKFPITPKMTEQCDYFTVLRDPVERIVSYLAYHRWNETAPFRRQIGDLSDRNALTILLGQSLGVRDEMCRYFGHPGDSLAAFQVAQRHYCHIGHVEDISRTFSFLKERGLSDGNEVRVNETKKPMKISLADRAFIRSHILEDIKLHDMLVACM